MVCWHLFKLCKPLQTKPFPVVPASDHQCNQRVAWYIEKIIIIIIWTKLSKKLTTPVLLDPFHSVHTVFRKLNTLEEVDGEILLLKKMSPYQASFWEPGDPFFLKKKQSISSYFSRDQLLFNLPTFWHPEALTTLITTCYLILMKHVVIIQPKKQLVFYF